MTFSPKYSPRCDLCDLQRRKIWQATTINDTTLRMGEFSGADIWSVSTIMQLPKHTIFHRIVFGQVLQVAGLHPGQIIASSRAEMHRYL